VSGITEAGDAFSFSTGYDQKRLAVPVDVTINEITWDEEGALASFSADILPQNPADMAAVTRDHVFSARLRWRAAAAPPAPNARPAVDAGEDRMLMAGASLELNGWMDDDLQPFGNNLVAQWEQISGPKLDIWFPDHLDADARFEKPGIYRLRLTVTDGVLSASDEVQITVGQPFVGKYDGLVMVDGRAVGAVALLFTRAGSVSGVLTAGNHMLRFRGAGASISRDFDLGGALGHISMVASEDHSSVTGFFYDGQVRAEFIAVQSTQGVFATAKGHTPLAGAYTFALREEGADARKGRGFGAISIGKSGAARVRGAFGDGTVFSAGVNLNTEDQMVIAIPLSGGMLASGVVNVNEDGSLSGQLTRGSSALKAPHSTAPPLLVRGTRYVKPTKRQNALTLASTSVNGRASLDLQSWARPIAHPLLLTPSRLLGNPATIQMEIDSGSGFVRGLFWDSFAQRSRAFRGAVLQRSRSAEGYFSAEQGAGSFELTTEE
jgi:hypothetical protein